MKYKSLQVSLLPSYYYYRISLSQGVKEYSIVFYGTVTGDFLKYYILLYILLYIIYYYIYLILLYIKHIFIFRQAAVL